MATESTLEQLRAQQLEIERKIAEQSIKTFTAYTAALGSKEGDKFFASIVALTDGLDDEEKARANAFVQMRTDLVKIAMHKVGRMETLIAPAS